jgi:predicted nuclease of predicted toxin-antitoxin system
MTWAPENRYIVFTNDLDYGALLFATAASSPSAIQIRAEDIRPASAEHAVLFALEAAAEDLSTGALVAIDPLRLRFSYTTTQHDRINRCGIRADLSRFVD